MTRQRLLVTGSRDWSDVTALRSALDRSLLLINATAPVTLVSGACPTGADRLAEEFWALKGWPVERHPADWSSHGKRAGFVRNAQMAELGANHCVAFPLGESRGTRMMMKLAQDAGIPLMIIEGSPQ